MMKAIHLILCSLCLFGGALHAQAPKAVQTSQAAATRDDLTDDVNVPSGKTLHVKSGGVLKAATGSTIKLPTLSDAPVTTDPDFALVVLPDTQILTFSDGNAATMTAQVQWAVTNKVAENVKAVIGLGDIANTPLQAEMTRAVTAYNLAKAAGIIVVPTIGNHDYDGASPSSRATTMYDANFGPAYHAGQTGLGATTYPSSSHANFYYTFTNGSTTFVIIALEFLPRPAAVSWAQGIIAANPSAYIILTTHACLKHNGRLVRDGDDYSIGSCGLPSDDYNGEEMYDALVKPYTNVRMMLCGHFISGPKNARASEVSATTGAVSHFLFTDYQDAAAADHYMQILRFKPASGVISVSYYSPSLAQEDPETAGYDIAYQPIKVEDSISVDKDAWVGRDLRVKGRAFLGPGELDLAPQQKLKTVGAYDATFTFTAATGVTFPTTGTLATLAGAEALSGKTYAGSTLTLTGTGAFGGNVTATLAQNNLTAVTISNTNAGNSASARLQLTSDVGTAILSQYSTVHSIWPNVTLLNAAKEAAINTALATDPVKIWTGGQLRATFVDTGTTLAGNLTVSGTGASSVGGNFTVTGNLTASGTSAHAFAGPVTVTLAQNNITSVTASNTNVGNSASARFTATSDVGSGGLFQYSTIHSVWPNTTLIQAAKELALNTAAAADPVKIYTGGGLRVTVSDTTTTLGGNLTVSGTGTNTFAGAVSHTSTSAGYIDGIEQGSDPAAPAANTGRLYFKDNGSGKTQLVVRFPTGAVQVIATEP